MSDHSGGEYLLAAYIGQQIRQAEYNGKVNALVAAGHPMGEARTIVNAWYAYHQPGTWYPGVWALTSAVFAFLAGVALVALGDVFGVFLWGSISLGCGLRCRWCLHAIDASVRNASWGQRILAEYGQL